MFRANDTLLPEGPKDLDVCFVEQGIKFRVRINVSLFSKYDVFSFFTIKFIQPTQKRFLCPKQRNKNVILSCW